MVEAILFSNPEQQVLNQLAHTDVKRKVQYSNKTHNIPVIFFCSVMKGTKLRYAIFML